MLSAATGMVILPGSLTFADSSRSFGAQRQPVTAESGTARPADSSDGAEVQSQVNRLYSRFGGKAVRAPREVAPALVPASGSVLAKSGTHESGIRQASNEVPQSPVNEPARLNDVAPARQAIESSRPARALFTVKSANSGVRQVSGANEGQYAQSAPNSEVQRKLEEMYRKNGREMPSMQMQDLPERNLKQKLPPLPQQATAQPTGQPVAQSRVSNFFKSISPFKSAKSSTDERPSRVEKMSPEQVRQQQSMQAQQPAPNYQNFQSQNFQSRNLQGSPSQGPALGLLPQPAAPAAEVPQVTAPRLFPPAGTSEVRELPMKAGELPEFRPVVQLPPSTKSVSLPETTQTQSVQPTAAAQPEATTAPAFPALSDTVSDTPFGAETEFKKPAANPTQTAPTDELGNAFPDVSEAEADGKSATKPKATVTTPQLPTPANSSADPKNSDENPFTGLKLETEGTVSPSQPPLLPNIGKSAAPALPLGSDDDDDDDDDMDSDQKLDDASAAKLRKIAERAELKGLKGFCPVTLRDDRDLADARPQFKAVFQGKVYNFATEEARDKFEKTPKAYAPIAGGNDVVASKIESSDVEGSLEHAVWFRDRLYLFSSAKTKAAFEATPTKFATE